jgi:hypothetical protein
VTAVVLSVIIFITPYAAIVKYYYYIDPIPEQIYDECRIFLPSEYDRLNPSTSNDGIKDYMDYLAQYTKRIELNTSSHPS